MESEEDDMKVEDYKMRSEDDDNKSMETKLHIGPVVNIGDNCAIDGDMKTSTIYNIKLYFKGTCNLN